MNPFQKANSIIESNQKKIDTPAQLNQEQVKLVPNQDYLSLRTMRSVEGNARVTPHYHTYDVKVN